MNHLNLQGEASDQHATVADVVDRAVTRAGARVWVAKNGDDGSFHNLQNYSQNLRNFIQLLG